jgi:hypothetical protein
MAKNEIYDRFSVEPTWPGGGYLVTNPMDDRNWDVQQFTGYPVSNVQSGQWMRGSIIRMFTPNVHPPILGYFAYDPTDPGTWHQPQH